MFTRSITRLTLALIIVGAALLFVTSFTATAATTAATPVARPHADLIVNPGESIQAAIDAANDGDTILINAGDYTESLTLSKPVSLTGVNSDTTILHAVAGQRVLTVTGATISTSVVISGLTFTGGDATGGQGADVYPPSDPGIIMLPTPTRTPTPIPTLGSHATSLQQTRRPERAADSPAARSLAWLMQQSPDDFAPTTDGLGGGLLITNSAQPQLQAVRLNNNLAGYGGGLYADGTSPLRLSRVDASDNVAMSGGGLYANAPITLDQARLSNNISLSTGGGAYVLGALTLLNSEVTHNASGGLHVQGNLTAQRSDISFNTSTVNGYYGGGVTQSAGQLLLDDVTVEGNTSAGWMGSGIFASGSTVWITDTRVMRNSGYPGSGLVLINGSSGQVVNSLFTQNSSPSPYGASIYSWGDLQIIHTVIADTSLNPGAAIYFEVGSLHITNTVIASYTTGIRRSQVNTGVTEDYNLFYGNTTDRDGVTPGAHSLNGDPMFVDPLNDDYHVLFDSPAIDAGVDAGVYTDLDGNVRPHGAGFDIGAYEFSNATRYVATTGDDASNPCLDQLSPCSTVQHAIDVANDGDQVLIASGLYTQSATLSKPVSLTGVNSDTTILHAVAGQRVLTVTGATISNSVVISGLTFTGGSANYGGGLYSDCTVTLISMRFISNTATIGGGALTQVGATISNSQFIENQASPYSGGGFACVNYICSLNIANTDFLNNTAGESGGGLYSEAGPIVLVSSRFEGNVSHNLGGGLMRFQCCDMIYMTDTQFISNTAVGYYGGGGAFAGPVTISGGRFERNVSTGSGGGGLFGAGTISGTSFISNSANAGGGFYGSGTIINARFEGNQAAINDAWLGGGGAVAAGGGETVISRTQFINNFSAIRGGAISAQGTNRLKIVDSLFTNNVAPEGTAVGDVSYLGSAGNISLLHVTIANTQLNPASAVSILSFTAQLTNTIIANHAIGISNIGGTVTEDYNLFYDNVTNTVGVTMGAHSLVGDPRFVDPAHADYHLAFGSAAIDHGADTGVYTDLDGNPRPIGAGFDIGAYEYPFVPSNYTLTVATTGNGGGVVSPTVGTHPYLDGEVVTLTATPLISSTFTGWSGDVSGADQPITVTMDTNKSVTVTFALNTFVITPTASANGTITPATPQTINYGVSHTFTITPSTGYHIADVVVDGMSQGAIGFYTFTNVTASHTISVAFAINIYTLDVGIVAANVGDSVLFDQPCPCYPAGTIVTLTAVPGRGSRFTDWLGDVVTTTNPLALTMDSNKAIIAVFASRRVYLPILTR